MPGVGARSGGALGRSGLGERGDKGFRDAALPGEAAPEPAVLPRSRGSSPAFPSSAPVRW